jgi:energy-coupling factor transporter transmembrane protein EcfT
MFDKDTIWLVVVVVVVLLVLFFAAKFILGFVVDHPGFVVLISVLVAGGAAVYFALKDESPSN